MKSTFFTPSEIRIICRNAKLLHACGDIFDDLYKNGPSTAKEIALRTSKSPSSIRHRIKGMIDSRIVVANKFAHSRTFSLRDPQKCAQIKRSLSILSQAVNKDRQDGGKVLT